MHATVYYGMAKGNVLNGQIKTVKYSSEPNAPYPGRYLEVNGLSEDLVASIGTSYPKNAAEQYGLVKLPDQNLEHFVRGH
jgi:hypothetical protein